MLLHNSLCWHFLPCIVCLYSSTGNSLCAGSNNEVVLEQLQQICWKKSLHMLFLLWESSVQNNYSNIINVHLILRGKLAVQQMPLIKWKDSTAWFLRVKKSLHSPVKNWQANGYKNASLSRLVYKKQHDGNFVKPVKWHFSLSHSLNKVGIQQTQSCY